MSVVRLRSPKLGDSAHPDESYLSRLSGELPPLVFIMGDHRSGTTLLYQSLINTGAFDFTSAYHIVAAPELLRNRIEGTEASAKANLNDEFEKYVGSDRVIDGVPVSTETPEEYGFILENASVGRAISRKSLPYFRQLVGKMGFLADSPRPLLLKNPWDFPNFVPVWQWFPDAKFVFVHREPEAIVSSKLRALKSMMQRQNPYVMRISRSYAQIAARPWLFSAVRWLVSTDWTARRLVRRSRINTDYYFDHIAQVPAAQRIELSYEMLCSAPNETVSRILDTVGVTPREALNLNETIKPRKLEIDPQVASLKPLIAARLSRYLDFLQNLNAAGTMAHSAG